MLFVCRVCVGHDQDLFSDGPADVVGSVDPVKDFNSMIARRDGDYVAKGALCVCVCLCVSVSVSVPVPVPVPVPVSMWFSIASTRFITMLCTTAVEGIKAQIKRFVDDGGTAAHFAKAIECLRTMRAGCLSNYEEAAFNDFMKALKAEYESGVRVTQHALVNAVIVPDVACVCCVRCVLFARQPREAFWQILVATRISLIHNEECPSASVSHVTKAEADRVRVCTRSMPRHVWLCVCVCVCVTHPGCVYVCGYVVCIAVLGPECSATTCGACA